MASPAHGQAWSLPEVLRCGHPVLPDHQVPVWPALAPDAGPGAVAIAYGRTALASARLQHGVPKAKQLECAGALPSKRGRFAPAGRLHGHQVLGRR